MTSRAVVVADDAKMVKAHREFNKWKKKNPVSGTLRATDFTFALKHFDKFRRAITKNIPSFKSRKTYARAMVTTYIIGKKLIGKQGRTRGGNDPGLSHHQLLGMVHQFAFFLITTGTAFTSW